MSALTPFPPQEDCIHDMVDAITRHGYVINKSCTGTGKTLVTIETAKAMGKRLLVVCPAIVVTQWKRAIDQQGIVGKGPSPEDYPGLGNLCWAFVVGGTSPAHLLP